MLFRSQVVSTGRPSTNDASPIELWSYNSRIQLASRPTWSDVSVTLRDDVTGITTKLVGEQLQKQFDFVEMASASSGIDYKFLTRFEVLDGGNGANEPVVLESWELYGCYIKGSDYGPMNYGTNEAAAITITLGYDNANQGNQGGGGIGLAVGRTIGDVVTGIGGTP